MNTDYFKRVHPEPYRILGQSLKPLSLGRYRLLKRFDVAFVAEGEASAQAGDLILGIIICAHRCDEFLKWLDSGKFAKEVKRWSRKVCPRWRKAPDLVMKMQLFKSYITNHQEMPKYWDESQDQQSSSGAHWSHNVEVILRSQVGWTEEEINERPLTKALEDYCKYLETQGAIRLMNECEVAQGDENARILEEQFGKAVLN